MTNIHSAICGLVSVVLLLAGIPRQAGAAAPVEKSDVDRLAQPLVDDGWVASLAIGMISERGSATIGYGKVADDKPSTPDGDTVYEIGSVTKVFTGLLLADMVEKGEVRLDTPVQELLPADVVVPKYDDRAITLVDLATHTASFPLLPANMVPRDLGNPFADYSVKQLYAVLGKTKLAQAPGSKSVYSNVGVGLLGHALALRAGKTYEELVIDRIAQPLGMPNMRIQLDQSLAARLAQPHDPDGTPVRNWDLPTLAGAGALRSTVTDMLRFVAANLELTETPLAKAVRLSHKQQFMLPDGNTAIGLCWHINLGKNIVWHNGQTGGYHSYVGLMPDKKVGVVLLSNTSTMRVVDELGMRILDLATGGKPAALELPPLVLTDAALLENLPGHYEFEPAGSLDIKRVGDALIAKMTRAGSFRLWPSSNNRLFRRAVDATYSIEREGNEIVAVTWDVMGKRVRALRVK